MHAEAREEKDEPARPLSLRSRARVPARWSVEQGRVLVPTLAEEGLRARLVPAEGCCAGASERRCRGGAPERMAARGPPARRRRGAKGRKREEIVATKKKNVDHYLRNYW